MTETRDTLKLLTKIVGLIATNLDKLPTREQRLRALEMVRKEVEAQPAGEQS